MRLLAIDTTGPGCAVALRVPGQEDILVRETMARGQAERLAPMVEDVLSEAGLSPQDLDRIGVCTGPGSFAGSRIGVAFARGLALAIGAECVGITRLAWLAANLPAGDRVLVVHDARRGDVVMQAFERGEALGNALTMSTDSAKDAYRTAYENYVMLGSGIGLLTGKAEPSGDSEPDLRALLSLIGFSMPPFDPPKPFYARPPDAKLPRDVTL